MSQMDLLLKSCGKCGGDLRSEGDEWSCFQCGHVFYPERTPEEVLLDFPGPGKSRSAGGAGGERKRHKARHAVPLIEKTGPEDEEGWLETNREVIFHLDKGKNVREVSEILGTDPRHVRTVRERLSELRSEETELVGA